MISNRESSESSDLAPMEIPLTVFTLAGGAIAIGVGFGSQKIVNNFFSDLILLVERPIKVGDLIEVGDTFGEVESIGARSTKINPVAVAQRAEEAS